MKQWLQQLLHKLRNYDELWEEHQQLQQEHSTLEIHWQSLSVTIKEYERELDEKKESIRVLKDRLTKSTNSYNEIEQPKYKLSELEKSLQLADKFTMRQISEYLKLDSYELVKNMAKVMNKDNASEVMAHRDGGLQRNDSLIKILDKLTVEKTFQDKFTGEKKTI